MTHKPFTESQEEPCSHDGAYWLSEYQKTLTNVYCWVSHGRSETTVQEIDKLIARWQRACIRSHQK